MQDFGHRFFISPEAFAEVSKALDASHLPHMPRLFFFDVRSNLAGDEVAAKRDFSAGHVPGARFLSFEGFFAGKRTSTNGRHPWPDVTALGRRLRALGLRPNDRLVFTDAGAMNFAARALLCARAAGFSDGAVLEGGFARWRALGLPVETGGGPAFEDAAAPDDNAPLLQPSAGLRCLSLDEVKAGVLEPLAAFRRIVLLDARPRKRWLGDEPADAALDGACGHVPGSINRPAGENLDAFGRMKSPERLRLEFETLFAESGIPLEALEVIDAPAPTAACPGNSSKGTGNDAKDAKRPLLLVHSCGSGVAACLNILALDRAGLADADKAVLYPGSWSEWARHPELPVARG